MCLGETFCLANHHLEPISLESIYLASSLVSGATINWYLCSATRIDANARSAFEHSDQGVLKMMCRPCPPPRDLFTFYSK